MIKDIPNLENLEIEGKIGFLRSRGSSSEKTAFFQLPHVSSMCLLPEDVRTSSGKFFFESSLDTPERFSNIMSKLLKKFPSKTQVIRDKMYSDGTRVSENEYGEVIQCIKKVAIGKGSSSLDIFCPSPNPAIPGPSFRISLKTEMNIDDSSISSKGNPTMERLKNRTSFEIGLWSVDLTEVETLNSNGSTFTREVEVELLNDYVSYLLEAVTSRSGTSSVRNNLFYKIVDSLLSTLRCLEEYSRVTT